MNQPLLPTSCILLTPTAIAGTKTAIEYKLANSGNLNNPQTIPKPSEIIRLNRKKYQYSLLLARPLNVA